MRNLTIHRFMAASARVDDSYMMAIGNLTEFPWSEEQTEESI
jgi:hypothetical protein